MKRLLSAIALFPLAAGAAELTATRPTPAPAAVASPSPAASGEPAASPASTRPTPIPGNPMAPVPLASHIGDANGPFAVPDGLGDAVGFWENVYARYSTRQVVMHDNRYLGVAYGVLDYSFLEDGKHSDPEIDEMIDRGVEVEKKRLVSILKELASYRGGVPVNKLTPEAKRIYKMFEPVDELDKFMAAAERVRGQRGQRDRFLKGISDVAPYMPKMEEIFKARGLPADLSRLTFVESMFNLHAYSKVGAAGPWQFMSGTGRLYLVITPEVDERMDPLKAADAASKLLLFNYKELGNWGLALTAYNHGVGGMRRAVRDVGSDDIGQIVWAYDSRSFGFASRNFFAEFLAAREVYNGRVKWFGEKTMKDLPQKPPIAWEEVVLPEHVAVSTFLGYTGVNETALKELNPAITSYVFSGAKYLPKSYPIRVPPGNSKSVVAAYVKIPKDLRFSEQKHDEYHVVKRGDTLVAIAHKYGMSVDSLMNMNTMGGGSRLRAGQKLRVLPQAKTTPIGVAVAALSPAEKARPKEKEPEVKVGPAVKLAEDQLSAEEAEVLATAEAPAEDENGHALPASTPGMTLLALSTAPLSVVSPEAALALAPEAPARTPAIPDVSAELALLEPGSGGMAAPPELVLAIPDAPASHEPSPLLALHDRSASGTFPGGVRCRLGTR